MSKDNQDKVYYQGVDEVGRRIFTLYDQQDLEEDIPVCLISPSELAELREKAAAWDAIPQGHREFLQSYEPIKAAEVMQSANQKQGGDK